jgi:hypothetical protein
MADRLKALSFKGLPPFSFSYAAHKKEKVPTKKTWAIAGNNCTSCRWIDVSA